jgi:hypothetical protein
MLGAEVNFVSAQLSFVAYSFMLSIPLAITKRL